MIDELSLMVHLNFSMWCGAPNCNIWFRRRVRKSSRVWVAMVRLEICGIPVEFLFPPYDSQLVYMEKVLLALTSKQNAILESPTGTGKVRQSLASLRYNNIYALLYKIFNIIIFTCCVQTLCLLCATLAWRRQLQKTLGKSAMATSSAAQQRPGASLAYEGYGSDGESDAPQLPRIIYSSRTHSQLKQVVQELKNTSYRPNVAVLGSREHLCVNEKVSKLRGTRQNLACRSTCKDRRCGWLSLAGAAVEELVF